ncbi:hypothetical protein JOF53_001508 [Crossiella equi]|uniref:Uncharacterized protein n=1 Tax=Crossiella equi TaxID=130796 RepID=A0ABS5A7S3_9PSEU|nr:hypothetical protein [Crossiella equi]MBP2472636.1 hypothetical protein [Crossiella equi]
MPVWPAYVAASWTVVYVVWVFLDISAHVLAGDHMEETVMTTVLIDSVLRLVTGVLILATVRPWRFAVPDPLMVLLAWAAAGGNLAFPLYKSARIALAPWGVTEPWPAPLFTTASVALAAGALLFVAAAVAFLNRARVRRRWAVAGLFLGFLVMYLPAANL